MTEKLLQYIWQNQYFDTSSLHTTDGEKVEIISAGKLNTAAGPDFSGALIRIGETLLAGSVELHIKTSLWNNHGHQFDDNYKKVVLHVVYNHDEFFTPFIPVLELQPLIPTFLLERYDLLMRSQHFIPCSGSVHTVNELVWTAWKERLLAERLSRKSEMVLGFLEQNHFHWEETLWWMLARNFGSSTNADAFECMARSIPVNILSKHKSQLIQLEALLLGQAGLLQSEFNESYPLLLQREYRFLQRKYQLQRISIPMQFMRMRPGNFPTVRLAQLAGLIHNSSQLFSTFIETGELHNIKDLLRSTANDYWHYHYRLDEASEYKIKNTGEEMIQNIIINTLVPVLFAYGLYHKNEQYCNKAIKWMEELKAESNAIIKRFAEFNIRAVSACDSQALLELKTAYCDHRQCLKCSIGNALLKTGGHNTERAFL